MTPEEIPQAWETYPAFVDGKPAMFFLNMGMVQAAPIASAPALYLVKVEMADPGPDGMGTAAEADRFMPFEDALCEAAAKAGLYFVGRVRAGNHWEMGFYGAQDLDLAELLEGIGKVSSEFEIMLGGGDDPDWEFLLGYLAPDRERWQWIMDHRVVRQLTDAGDDPSKPRAVDHAVHFETEDALEKFVADAKALGFTEAQRHHDANAELPWMVEVQREDPVMLSHIHDAVMDLIELVESHGGDYDGWGCPVTQ